MDAFVLAQTSTTTGGTALPGEIILLVVRWVVILCMHRSITPQPDTIFWRRTLGAMRLTCRFWAYIIRPLAFQKISLMSETHYARFASLLEGDGSIGNMVEFVALRDPSSRPWSHQALLSTALKTLGNVEHLILAGAQRVDLGKQRLARPPGLSGPGAFALIHHTFEHIRALTIEGAAFSAFSHLRHLLKGLPNLTMFDGRNVMWPAAQTRFGSLTLDVPKLAIVRTRLCTDSLLFVGLLLALPTFSRRQPTARPTLGTETKQAIIACMRAFATGWTGAIVTTWARDVTAKWYVTVL